MITCGIEIQASQAIFVILQLRNKSIENLTGNYKKLLLANDAECKQVRSFYDTLSQHFDAISPDRIGIVARNKGGPYPAGPVSFKIEAIIQLYPRKNVNLIHPRTLDAFQRKSQFVIPPEINKYQHEAYRLAYFLLHQ